MAGDGQVVDAGATTVAHQIAFSGLAIGQCEDVSCRNIPHIHESFLVIDRAAFPLSVAHILRHPEMSIVDIVVVIVVVQV